MKAPMMISQKPKLVKDQLPSNGNYCQKSTAIASTNDMVKNVGAVSWVDGMKLNLGNYNKIQQQSKGSGRGISYIQGRNAASQALNPVEVGGEGESSIRRPLRFVHEKQALEIFITDYAHQSEGKPLRMFLRNKPYPVKNLSRAQSSPNLNAWLKIDRPSYCYGESKSECWQDLTKVNSQLWLLGIYNQKSMKVS
ncbi:hypothetical protein L1987_46262 [Smallanthus sonchifolius]|uniref:Uncharacterized protein n=1 Tax=Smallanthus sonchifolius TaxID=185202 RepID=A0ACB9FZ22_9ASTR|nr:hypothetical protein L1987_46262 [Smallanthus sonchifolius]